MFDHAWAALEQREIKRRTGPAPAVEPGSRPRPDLPAGTDLLPQIKHIVVLMMENHSYDNYLGTLPGFCIVDPGPRGYDRLGFRVPTVIVSPYARPDFVTSTVFDRPSIFKLVEQKWNLPALTHRDAAAQAPLDALDLDAPPAFLTPPDLPAPSLPWHVG
jgi:phospholipase C